MGAGPVTFLDPWLLQVGVGLTALVLVGLRSHAGRRRRLADFIGGRRAVDRLSRSNLYRLRVERTLLLGIGGLALAAAAAEPHWSGSPELPPVKSVILAIDVSASMQAADVAPTRLARAVEVAGELLDALEDHRVGLLLFAGTGYPIAPPSHDHQALRFLMEGVTPTIASAYDPGSLLSVAIEEGVSLLERRAPLAVEADPLAVGADPVAQERAGERLIVLVTDGETGESDEDVSRAVEVAVEAGIGIHTIGVGTEQGAGMIIPASAYQFGGPVLDVTGAPSTSRLREPPLRDVAAAGGGRYANARNGAQLRALTGELQASGSIPEQNPDDERPGWARYDLPFLLGLGALVLILIESLLDMTLPERWSLRMRELAWGKSA
jgi:Ca-activated chloride channel family protein